jgi:prepilin-type N-terminal cleavage/methylation domain-containing protein
MKKAFTLVEVIIVTAIIAILAAIAFPIFVSAKRQAQAVDCLNSQHQIGLGLALYANDNEGWVPPYATTTAHSLTADITGRPEKWRDSLLPYTSGNKDTFWCHLDPHRGTYFVADGESVGDRSLVTSFQMASLFPSLFGDKQGNFHLNIDIGHNHPKLEKSPSQVVYLADAHWATGKMLSDNTLEIICGHGIRENRLYLDGHVVNKNIADE